MQSVSSEKSGESSDEAKRLCVVQFPNGREATYHSKNLEIVRIDGTGLVGTMRIAEAESLLWESLNPHNRGRLNGKSKRENHSKQTSPLPEASDSMNCAARRMLESAYGKYSVPKCSDAIEAALQLYSTVGPVATFAPPKAEMSLLAPEAFVGARVKVEWPGDDWYPGIVDKYDKDTGRHHVYYDDGDTRWYTFTADRKHAVSESENKLPLRFIGGTIAHTSSQLSHKNRRLVLSYLDYDEYMESCMLTSSLPSLLPLMSLSAAPVSPEDSSGTRLGATASTKTSTAEISDFVDVVEDDGAAPSANSLGSPSSGVKTKGQSGTSGGKEKDGRSSSARVPDHEEHLKTVAAVSQSTKHVNRNSLDLVNRAPIVTLPGLNVAKTKSISLGFRRARMLNGKQKH